jgi:hypothetical protein
MGDGWWTVVDGGWWMMVDGGALLFVGALILFLGSKF